MSEGDKLLQAILDSPNDDVLRLVYADWLEERGDPRGEFIRVQCELEALGTEDVRREILQRREIELISTNSDKELWFGKLRSELLHYDCRRGFVEGFIAEFSSFRRHAKALFQSHPIRRVWLRGVNSRNVASLAKLQCIARLSTLTLTRTRHEFLGRTDLAVIRESEFVHQLGQMVFEGYGFDEDDRRFMQERMGDRVRFSRKDFPQS